MTIIGPRAAFIKELEEMLKHFIVHKLEKTKDFEYIMKLLMEVSAHRYLSSRGSVIPKSSLLINQLFDYPEREFKTIVRMDKESFVRLVGLIENQDVFKNNSRNQQTPVWIQLAITLNRLGFDGTGSSINREAIMFGFSYGSVELFTNRVFKAILNLEEEYVRWPNARKRRRISERIKLKHGFSNCVGFLDGTPIVLFQKPGVDGEVYFSRKKQYAINLQLWCNDLYEIMYYLSGFPSSVYDQTTLDRGNCPLFDEKTSELFFSPLEYGFPPNK